MSNLTILLLFAIIVVIAGQAPSARGLFGSNGTPRLLWFRPDRNSKDQPIIIIQPSQPNSQQNQHPFPYPYYPPPQQPPFSFPGSGYGQGYGQGSIVIVNPNNMQGIYLPANSTSTARAIGAGGGRRRIAIESIAELLQNVNETEDSVEDEADQGSITSYRQPDNDNTNINNNYNSNSNNQANDVPSADELAMIERQSTQGVNPRHYLAYFSQDRRRQRFQEAVANIYLRNFNANRK